MSVQDLYVDREKLYANIRCNNLKLDGEFSGTEILKIKPPLNVGDVDNQQNSAICVGQSGDVVEQDDALLINPLQSGGPATTVQGARSTVIGGGCSTSGANAVVVGSCNIGLSVGQESIKVGHLGNNIGNQCVAVGHNIEMNGFSNCTLVGYNACSQGNANCCLGRNNDIRVNNCGAIKPATNTLLLDNSDYYDKSIVLSAENNIELLGGFTQTGNVNNSPNRKFYFGNCQTVNGGGSQVAVTIPIPDFTIVQMNIRASGFGDQDHGYTLDQTGAVMKLGVPVLFLSSPSASSNDYILNPGLPLASATFIYQDLGNEEVEILLPASGNPAEIIDWNVVVECTFRTSPF